MARRADLAGTILIILALATIGKGYAGATGEESLGSEELPVIWGFVSPWGVDFSDTIEQYLAPLELETSLYIDARLYERYSELVSALSSGQIHVVTLPIFTYLVAKDRGLVDTGLLAEHISTNRQIVLVTRSDREELEERPLVFARFDPLSSDGWLALRLVLSGNGITEIEESEIVEVGSYQEAIDAVSAANADLLAMPRSIWEDEERPGNLKIFTLVESIVSDGVYFFPAIDLDVKERIGSALLERSAAGRLGLLAAAFGWKSLRSVDQSEFDRFRLIAESVGIEIEDLP